MVKRPIWFFESVVYDFKIAKKNGVAYIIGDVYLIEGVKTIIFRN
jgi:hypothetical protein